MKVKSNLFILLTLLLLIVRSNAQDVFTEVGLGIGNAIGEEHAKGKAEIYFNVLKAYRFGEIGLDFSTGGNFIPGNVSGIEDDIENLSPNDAKFNAISVFYRLPIKKIYIEPRFGYATLSYLVNADNERKINQTGPTYGLGIGATIVENLSVSLRYQNLGNTPDYEGTSNSVTIISKSGPLDLVLLRVAYRFDWKEIF